MQTHAAFLRGVNLGSRRQASGADLRAALEGAAFGDVATFRNSGNVVFTGTGAAAKLTEQVEACIAKQLGFDVKVYLRTAKEVRAVAERQPFPAETVEASNGKLQVGFLDKKLSDGARKKLKALGTDEDLLEAGPREVYWLPSGGMRDSSLDFKPIHAIVGELTMRTMGTVQALAAKFF